MAENILAALGGGDSIGTSAYYLALDGCRFLLDCGAKANGRRRQRLPRLEHLRQHYLSGFYELDRVVLSHAHFDHIGGIAYLFDGGYRLPITANPITAELATMQLRQFDRLPRGLTLRLRQQYEARLEQAINCIEPLGFGRTLEGDGYRLTLYRAGHIPGAAMTYIETDRHRFLYTGDFSAQTELLAGAYSLPDGLSCDVLLLNGTHAGRSRASSPAALAMADYAAQSLFANRAVEICTHSLSKGIELSRCLEAAVVREAKRRQTIGGEISHDLPRVYLDARMERFADAFEACHYEVFSPVIRPFSEWRGEAAAFIGEKYYRYGERLDGEMFTLHAELDDLADLVQRVSPRTVFLVHSDAADGGQRLDFALRQRGWGGDLFLAADETEFRFE